MSMGSCMDPPPAGATRVPINLVARISFYHEGIILVVRGFRIKSSYSYYIIKLYVCKQKKNGRLEMVKLKNENK
jgi:hypothetical protein